MLEKKNVVINCDVCDSRKMKKEDWENYERITINADILIVNEKSKSILNDLPVICNVDETIAFNDDTEWDINLITCNGNYEITGNTSVAPNSILSVNGSLTIHPGTEEILKSFYKIGVNGNVIYPDNLAPFLNKLSVNGNSSSYPADSVLLKPSFTVDKYFPLRAKENGKYYAARKVILTDQGVDVKALLSKNISFVTSELIVSEDLVADTVSLVDENVDLKVIPSGYSFIDGNVTLDKSLLIKNGSKFYIHGDLTLTEESTALFSEIEEIIVGRTVHLLQDQVEAFQKICREYGKLEIITPFKGRVIENRASLKIDSSLLDASQDGLIIQNCAFLTIKDDVTPKQLLDLVKIENCATIKCTPEQRSSVELIIQNVATISDGSEPEEDSSMNPLDMMKNIFNSRVINADKYVL